MRQLMRSFFDRYFHDEEAIIFTILLIFGIVVVMTMGSILAPIFAAVVTAYLLQGLVNSLLQYKVPYLVAVTLVYALFISLFLAIFFLLLPQVWVQFGRLINELPRLISEGQELLFHLPEAYPSLITQEQLRELLATVRVDLADWGQTAVTYSLAGIPRLFNWMIFLVLVPVLVFFMMKDKDQLVGWISNQLPHNRPLMLQIWKEMDVQLANYIRGKALEIFVVGSASYITFMILGMNYALLLSVMVGLSVVIPFIGVAVVAIPVMLVAYVQWGIGGEFVAVVVAYSVIQLLDANVLVPIIFSETVNLHPVAIIAAVLVFGGLWGLAGVFFAIPLATLIKAIMNAWPDTNRKGPPEDAAKAK
ncbi:MAG: AI-2E family transporter [Pseudohongiellaceae bacterium]|nr:AI-2E family transporter [Pseudohongiellaceae bacterium]